MTTREATLRDRMIANAKAYNKALTSSYLTRYESETILNFTHVTDRNDFSYELKKIREAEL